MKGVKIDLVEVIISMCKVQDIQSDQIAEINDRIDMLVQVCDNIIKAVKSD